MGQTINDDNKSKIPEIHETWSLENEKNQFSNSRKFLKEVMFKVPLDKLYELVASCQYKEESDFCPVLVRVVDKNVRLYNEGKMYLL